MLRSKRGNEQDGCNEPDEGHVPIPISSKTVAYATDDASLRVAVEPLFGLFLRLCIVCAGFLVKCSRSPQNAYYIACIGHRHHIACATALQQQFCHTLFDVFYYLLAVEGVVVETFEAAQILFYERV